MTHAALKALEAMRDYLRQHPTAWTNGNGFVPAVRSATTNTEVARQLVKRLRVEIGAHPDAVSALSNWAAEHSNDEAVALLETVLADEVVPFRGCACGQVSFACLACGWCTHPGSPPCECSRAQKPERKNPASNVVGPEAT